VSDRQEADARLAELVELAGAAPPAQQRTEQLLTQVLRELQQRTDGPSDDVLRLVLRELRSKAIASMDELRITIRSELDARLAPGNNPGSFALGNYTDEKSSNGEVSGASGASSLKSQASSLSSASSLLPSPVTETITESSYPPHAHPDGVGIQTRVRDW